MATQPAPAKGWQESSPSFPAQEHNLRDIQGQYDFANEKARAYVEDDGFGQQLLYRMGVASDGRENGLELATALGLGGIHDRLLLSINKAAHDLRARFPRASKATMVTLSALSLLITWSILLLLFPVQAVPRPQVAGFFNSTTSNVTTPEALSTTYWISNIQRQGTVPFGGSGGYAVFRNVKTFGARGDGVTDDTAAINNAISSGGRCGQGCDSSTTTPAIVYFPPGTYVVSAPIIQYYYTQLVGDALSIPTLKSSPGFQGIAVIDADPYAAGGVNWYTNQNNFFRQVRNFVIDVTAQPASTGTGIHWQVAQATSLQNIRFEMQPGSNQQGIFMDNGSGGFMTDLIFNGGNYGAFLGNQQFTTRNMTFNGCKTAIFMNWNWAWTFKSLNINNCGVGIDMSNGGNSQTVGSVLIVDSKMTNTPKGVVTSYSSSSTPETGGTLVMDNVDFTGSSIAVARADGSTVLAGGSVVSSWAQGNSYTPSGSPSTYSKTRVQGTQTGPSKPAVLLNGGSIYERSRPQYESVPASSFVSVKSAGAKGDGVTDDSNAIQAVFNNYQAGQIVYFDHGAYIITKTIKVPKNIKITGEIWPLIMASGPNFQDQTKPIPVFQVGQVGDVGNVEMSDLIFETAGPCPGAILMEWNVAESSQGSAGLWDVHFRIGGTAGTQLQSNTCAKNPSVIAPANPKCEGAFMLMHITSSATCYLENVWGWVSDHELDLSDHSQINIYNGRGFLVESQGPVWMYGTASEHSQLYNYQFANAKNIWIGLAQTETPYYQSNPNALTPFTPNPTYNDPDFSSCTTDSCRKAWGLRVFKSSNVLLYGAGFYSFFDNYSQDCLATESCQTNMVSVEQSTNTWLYGLSTKASTNMVTLNGSPVVLQADNRDNFCSTIELFKQT